MNTQILISLSPEELKNLLSSCIKSELQDYHNKEPPPKDDSLMTRKEAAAYLMVSLPTIIRYERAGYIASFRVGNKIRFKKSQVYSSLKLIKSIKHSRRSAL